MLQNYDQVIQFKHVPGHSNDKLYDLADKLTKEGADLYARSSKQFRTNKIN